MTTIAHIALGMLILTEPQDPKGFAKCCPININPGSCIESHWIKGFFTQIGLKEWEHSLETHWSHHKLNCMICQKLSAERKME